MNKYKSMIFHFEGADKTGKDAVRNLIIKKTGGNALVLVRSYLSNLVYAKLYERKIDVNFFFNHLTAASLRGDKFVVFTVSRDVASKRFIEHDEQDIKIEDFEEHQNAFLDYAQGLKTVGVETLVIDTSEKTPEETADTILNHYYD